MPLAGSMYFSHNLGLPKDRGRNYLLKSFGGRGNLCIGSLSLSSRSSEFWSTAQSRSLYAPVYTVQNTYNAFKCYCFLGPSNLHENLLVKTAAAALSRPFSVIQSSPVTLKLVAAISVVVFALWGLGPLMRQSRRLLLHKNDNNWKKSNTYYVTTSYLQPLVLWIGATILSRALDPVVLPTEATQVIKQRLLNFVRSLSTVLALAYCLSSVIQQTQKFLMDKNDPSDARNMGFQFAGRAVYTAVWVAAVSLFMELLGFSTQKWLTAGGLGTVLLTLAGREIFTNFLSSAMLHATRPFIVNEWIQTRIEGYDVSGTVEHVGWWSPTIVRGEDREAVHIPNHKFTMNVVRNLSQKTHWRIKTHLAISHLDVSKIHNIVADMRKVLAKNPQVEQQRLHRRVFLDNINPENQALLILVSCFVKTSHYEEYLCVKEAILLDLLRVISHHRARLATPIRTMQRVYSDNDLENVPFSDAGFPQGGVVPNRPLLIEPLYKINGEDKTKARATRTPAGEQGGKKFTQPTPDTTADSKAGNTQTSDSKVKDVPTADLKFDTKNKSGGNIESKENKKNKSTPASDEKIGENVKSKAVSKPVSRLNAQVATPSVEAKQMDSIRNKLAEEVSDGEQSNVVHPAKSLQKSEAMSSSVPTLGADTDKEAGTAPQSNLESKKMVSQPPVSRPGLEDNIVLGVALEGGKRTLPIEEEVIPPTNAGLIDLNAKKNKDGSVPASPSKSSTHQKHQLD
ncbi:mechanosensitive ion channel protein 2, chloroplastic-like isoform X2 [Rhodamnia argentea]|uniref:Mechanosensitive ion channel protein 2, chloroplastic-like isoform X2 n=1 Tax=Rhodamnia argentea TaxID=178133 RepID=A0A8B8P0G0_9MYRT|nr:mechanosensitive ion channel protein 2, chloroplastic-like isoform X2 [Rhodamnia argentea]